MISPSWAIPLPALLPLGLALLSLISPAGWVRSGAWLGTALCAASPLPGLWLLLSAGPMDVALGGWAPPLGIRLVMDGLTVLVLLFHGLVGLFVGLYAGGATGSAPSYSVPKEQEPALFWAMFFLLWSGLNALALSQDLFNLYVTLEFISLAGVGLILLTGTAAAIRAAITYLLLALLGGLLYLLGVGLVYSHAGTLDLQLVTIRLQPHGMLNAGLGFMLVGLMIKAALFPMHTWLPPAHGSAQAPVSALLSGLVVSAAYLVVLRLWTSGFHELAPAALPRVFSFLGCTGILWGGWLALRQDRLKRVLAYSTVSQTGYLFLVFALSGTGSAGAGGVWAGSLYLTWAHGLAKAGAFLSAGLLMRSCGSDRLNDLRGAVHQNPIPVGLLALAAVTLIGLPPGLGFLGKWMLLDAALEQGKWMTGATLLLGGLLAAAYLMRVIEICFRPGDRPDAPAEPADRGARSWPVLVLVLLPFVLSWFVSGPNNLLRLGAPFEVPSLPQGAGAEP